MRSSLALFLLTLALLAGCTSTSERDTRRVELTRYNTANDLALEGHDPVTYFPEGGGRPMPGDPDRIAVHDGITYRFASEPNRELFLASPERFLPAYGGWCAYAMADGERVSVDPRSFLIQNGKLMLFYDGWFADTRAMWQENGPEELEARADRAWRELVRTTPRR